MQTVQGYTELRVFIPNKEVEFFKKLLKKFNFKIDKVLKKESDDKIKKAKTDDIIQKRLAEFKKLTGVIEVDTYPTINDRKNARLERYAK